MLYNTYSANSCIPKTLNDCIILFDALCQTLKGKEDSQGLCPHGVYSLEEKRNTKLVDKVGFKRCYESNRSRKAMEGDNRSGKTTHMK